LLIIKTLKTSAETSMASKRLSVESGLGLSWKDISIKNIPNTIIAIQPAATT
jgi:hypothetical protein